MFGIVKKVFKPLQSLFGKGEQSDIPFHTKEERALYLRKLGEKIHKMHLIENKDESLWDSVLINCVKDIQFLIEQGADLNALHNWGWTPLIGAIQKKNNKVAKILIDAGTDIAQHCNLGLTALHWAGICRQTAIGKLLIEKKAPLDARDDRGYTPLLLAAEYGADCLVTELVQKGADVRLRSNNGETALMKAVSKNLKCQSSYEHLYFLKPGQKEKIAAFAVKRSQNIIKTLIEAGVDIDAQNAFGETALIIAAKNYNFEQVQLLLQSGANPDLRNCLGKKASDYWKKHQLEKFLKGQTDLVKPVRRFDCRLNVYIKENKQHFRG